MLTFLLHPFPSVTGHRCHSFSSWERAVNRTSPCPQGPVPTASVVPRVCSEGSQDPRKPAFAPPPLPVSFLSSPSSPVPSGATWPLLERTPGPRALPSGGPGFAAPATPCLCFCNSVSPLRPLPLSPRVTGPRVSLPLIRPVGRGGAVRSARATRKERGRQERLRGSGSRAAERRDVAASRV